MIRAIVERAFTPDKNYVELFGLSTDSKPTAGIVTGSIFCEVDTGKVYFYNEVESLWVEQFSFQG